jgi:hypothetical protein
LGSGRFTLPHTSSPSTRSAALPPAEIAALAGFLVLALAWTWPLALHLGSRVPHDPGDPILEVWLLWWNAHAVPFTARWWSPPIFDPMPGALALSEHMAGLGVITTPLQLAGAGPLAAYNVALIASYALSGYFAYLLVRRLSASRAAGFCAGLAFAFAPYRAGQLAHLQVLTSQWMPLALLALHQYLEDGRRRWLALFSAAWLIQALSNGYYLLFFPVLLALWLLWFGRSRRGAVVAGAWGVSSLALVPVLLQYVRVQRSLGLARSAGEMWLFSATPRSFVSPAGLLAAWPFTPAPTDEHYLFPGLTAVVLVLAACAHAAHARDRRSGPLIFYAVAAVVMYACALGPARPDSGLWAIAHPYSLLVHLPGFDGLRVPARFAMLGTLSLAVGAGLSVARLAEAFPGWRPAVVVAIAGLALDGWMTSLPLIAPPGQIVMPSAAGAALLELPSWDATVNTAAMYRAMQHGRPLVNGYSGYTPPHYTVLTTAASRGDPSAIAELARGRPLIVLVNSRLDPAGELRRLVESIPGVERGVVTGAGATFVIPRAPVVRDAPLGPPLRIALGGVERNRVEIDLGSEQIVRAVEFPLAWHAAELDPRIAIEASLDRTAWSTVWEDWTGGLAVRGALEDPLRAPVRMVLADVRARYLRIHPAPRWMLGELHVRGPG